MKALAAALSKAQAQMDGAKKDANNPHFKSKYADLSSVWDACRTALTSHGLSVVQFGEVTEAGMVLTTRLLHDSGEFVEGRIPLLNGKGDMQGLGSALTYARRYGLAAMVGVCPEDDDGNAASEKPQAVVKAPEKPEGYDYWLHEMSAAADTGLQALTAAWKASPEPMRAAMPATVRDTLKARAAKVTA